MQIQKPGQEIAKIYPKKWVLAQKKGVIILFLFFLIVSVLDVIYAFIYSSDLVIIILHIIIVIVLGIIIIYLILGRIYKPYVLFDNGITPDKNITPPLVTKKIKFIHFGDIYYFKLPTILKAFPYTLIKIKGMYLFSEIKTFEYIDPINFEDTFKREKSFNWITIKIVLKNNETFSFIIDNLDDLILFFQTFNSYKKSHNYRI